MFFNHNGIKSEIKNSDIWKVPSTGNKYIFKYPVS